MIYNTVVFLLTNKCNLECKHCSVECSPKNSAILDDSVISQVISDLSSNPKITTIAISGGEVFMYPDKVFKIIKAINQAGKRPSIYTNGFWCSDYEKTYKVLADLKKNGLKLLLTSIDTYHQEGIPIDNIKNLLDVCNKLNILTKVHVSTTYPTLSKDDEIVSSLGLSKLSVSITTSPVIPVGRASEKIKKEEVISAKEISQLRCAHDGSCIVDWDGDVFLCCSLHNKNMVIGNVKNGSINSILNNFRRNRIFMCMNTKGIPHLANIIERHNIIPLNKNYVDGCDLCNRIFENRDVMEQLETILRKEG